MDIIKKDKETNMWDGGRNNEKENKFRQKENTKVIISSLLKRKGVEMFCLRLHPSPVLKHFTGSESGQLFSL